MSCTYAAGKNHKTKLRASAEPSPIFCRILCDSWFHPSLFPEVPKSLPHPPIQTLPPISLKTKLKKEGNEQRTSIDSPPHLPSSILCPLTLSNDMDRKQVSPIPPLRYYISRMSLQNFSLFPPRTSTVSLSTGSFPTAYRLVLKIKTVGLHFSL